MTIPNPTNEYRTDKWLAAFRAQVTPMTMEAALRCAAIEIERLHHFRIDVAWNDEDLVQQILAATWAGGLHWNPELAPLRVHLRDKIRLIGTRLRRRHVAGHAPTMVALDALTEDDALWSDVEDALDQRSPAADHAVADLARRLEAELWELAAGDGIALRVLAQMSEGTTANREIARELGLPVGLIVNAKKRIRRLALHASPPLLADIQAELNLDVSADSAAPCTSVDGLDRSND